ncbi:MAG TPA: hypothetical protein VH062_01520 [Polyangiaceae bacterium]|nr:hypothetical protein [Polyangiaceae bacterium]
MHRKTLFALPALALLFTAACSKDGSPFTHDEAREPDADTMSDGGVRTTEPPKSGAGGATTTHGGAGGAHDGTAGTVGAAGEPVAHHDASAADAGRSLAGDGGATIPVDAATTDAGPATCTTRLVWYADGDGDGFGNAASAMVGCTKPGDGAWVSNSEDCDDGDARVHPGQKTYFGTAYTATTGDDSFDYDCSGGEDPDPSAPLAPTSCNLVGVGACGGSGYLATKRAAGNGTGRNALCGSAQMSKCESTTLILCGPITVTVEAPFGCH